MTHTHTPITWLVLPPNSLVVAEVALVSFPNSKNSVATHRRS